MATRKPVDATVRSSQTPAFGTLALQVGGKPGMTVPSRPGTTGSIFEIYLGSGPPFNGAAVPEFGRLLDDEGRGAEVLRAIAASPVTNDYLVESRGRSMPGSPSFARPRDVPRERIAIVSVRVQ